jgi:hypothetical protein
MGTSRPIWGPLVVLAALAAGVFAPASALADSVATTGGVTNLTSSSVVLHGTVNPDQPQSEYFFEYGTTTQPYSNRTNPAVINGTIQNVSAGVSGLLPGTTYHYRLVVQGLYTTSEMENDGNDAVFTTPTNAAATTGQASSVTSSSAELNGVANTGDSNSAWFFQYGRTTGYGQQTPTQPIGKGLTLVSALVRGLSPRTTYHYRLVVLQSSVVPTHGADSSFTTAPPNGHATLASHRLKVRHGFAAIPFKCGGAQAAVCKAQVSLKSRGKVGKHVANIACGNGKLSTRAPHRQTVHVKLGRCGAPLRQAKHGRLHATLRAVFSTNQRTLQTGVTLLKG